MATTFFAFTPNGYLYNSPAARSHSTLPDAVAQRLENSQPKIAEVYHAAFADNGAYFVAYRAAEAGKYEFVGIEHRGLSTSLLAWIGQYPNFRRDIPTLQVVFGPYGQYFAWDKHGHHPGAVLPTVASSIQQDGGPTTNPPRVFALGPGGSYIIVKQNGEYYYDLLGCSKEADEWLDRLCDIQTLPQGRPGALNELLDFSISNTKPGHFFSIWQNGTMVSAVSSEWHAMLATTTSAIKEYLQTVFPAPAYASPAPQKPESQVMVAEIRPSPVSAVSSYSLHSPSPSLVAPQPVHPQSATVPTGGSVPLISQQTPVSQQCSPQSQSLHGPVEMQAGQQQTPGVVQQGPAEMHAHSPPPQHVQQIQQPSLQQQVPQQVPQRITQPTPQQVYGQGIQVQHQSANQQQAQVHHPQQSQQYQATSPQQTQQLPLGLGQPQSTPAHHHSLQNPQAGANTSGQSHDHTSTPAIQTYTYRPPTQSPGSPNHHAQTPSILGGSATSWHQQAATGIVQAATSPPPQRPQVQHAPSIAPSTQSVETTATTTSSASGSAPIKSGKRFSKVFKGANNIMKGAVKVSKDLYNAQTHNSGNEPQTQATSQQQVQQHQQQQSAVGHNVQHLTQSLNQAAIPQPLMSHSAGQTVSSHIQQVQYIQRIVHTPQGPQVQYVQVQQPIRPASAVPSTQVGHDMQNVHAGHTSQTHPNQFVHQHNNLVQQQQTYIVQQPGQATPPSAQVVQQHQSQQTHSEIPAQALAQQANFQIHQTQPPAQPIVQVQQQVIQSSAASAASAAVQTQTAPHPQTTAGSSAVKVGKIEPTLNFSPTFNFGGNAGNDERSGRPRHQHPQQQHHHSQPQQQQYYQQQPVIYEQSLVVQPSAGYVVPGGETVIVQDNGGVVTEADIVSVTNGIGGVGLTETQSYVYTDAGVGGVGTQQVAVVDSGTAWGVSDSTAVVAMDPSGVVYDYTNTTAEVTTNQYGVTDTQYQQTEVMADGSGDVYVQQDTLDVETDAAGNVSFEETETTSFFDAGADDLGGDDW